MSVITNLNSSNDRKIEKLLENNLIKYDETENEIERYRYKFVVDSIYGFERENAEEACKSLDNSLGFAYFSEYYKSNKRCLNFFCFRLIDEILIFKENVEGLIHEQYSSSFEFLNSNPKCFLISIISKYDDDLASYIKVNIADMKIIDNYIDMLKLNWREYEEERNECVSLISKLDDYYDKNGIKCKCSIIDIYIYLFTRNGMIPELKKYYKMEDTTDEEFDELIRESDIYSISKSIDDIRMIAEMDKIFKENIKKRGKRLIY